MIPENAERRLYRRNTSIYDTNYGVIMNLQEFNSLGDRDKHDYIIMNFPSNARSLSKRKMVHMICFNDANYCTNPMVDGKKVMCPAYMTWKHMLNRVFSDKCHAKQPTYSGVTLCSAWLSFGGFLAWWQSNQVDGWQLDKDLLSDSREYSPESCLFVPSWLNKFTINCGSARGEWPIGVHLERETGRFRAACSNPITSKFENLGRFSSPNDAHSAWLNRKLELALELKPKMDTIDARIYQRVVTIITRQK